MSKCRRREGCEGKGVNRWNTAGGSKTMSLEVTPPDLGFRLFMALGTEAAELFQKKWLKGGESWLLGP